MSGHLLAVDIKQIFKIPLIVTLGLSIFAWLLGGWLASFSVIAGATVFMLPNIVFARNIFKHKGASSAKQIVRAFYKGEGIKLVLSVILFAMVFYFFKVIPLVFFAVYITMQCLIWLTSIFVSE